MVIQRSKYGNKVVLSGDVSELRNVFFFYQKNDRGVVCGKMGFLTGGSYLPERWPGIFCPR